MTEILTKVARLAVLASLVSGMSAIGLGLTPRRITAPHKDTRLIVSAVIANFIISPLLAIAIVLLLPLLAGLVLKARRGSAAARLINHRPDGATLP